MMLSPKARDLLDVALGRLASDYNDVDASTTEALRRLLKKARKIEVKTR
jgi:hypothetical protein